VTLFVFLLFVFVFRMMGLVIMVSMVGLIVRMVHFFSCHVPVFYVVEVLAAFLVIRMMGLMVMFLVVTGIMSMAGLIFRHVTVFIIMALVMIGQGQGRKERQGGDESNSFHKTP
jgi:hypothetical protein